MSLSVIRKEFYNSLIKNIPDVKWGVIFGVISNQDKEAIKELKKVLYSTLNGKMPNNNLEFYANLEREIDKIFGEELTK